LKVYTARARFPFHPSFFFVSHKWYKIYNLSAKDESEVEATVLRGQDKIVGSFQTENCL